jgi:FkbM family methyltransferase
LGRTVATRHGTIHDRPDYDYGWAFALIHGSTTFFDVGCNVGLETLLACLDRPTRPVLAIDANPRALAIAAENLFLNGFAQRVRFALGFVGNADSGVADFYALGAGAAASDRPRRGATAHRVPKVTLDRLAEEVGLAPDLIKVDVEGAEAEVLAGAREITRRHRPQFLVEMHAVPDRSMGANGDLVLGWCREQDYDAYYLARHQLVTDPGPFAARGRCHLLLQPCGTPYPEGLAEIAQGDGIESAYAVVSRAKAARDAGQGGG